MKALIFGLIAGGVLCSVTSVAQVADIKRESSNSGRPSPSSSSSSSSSPSPSSSSPSSSSIEYSSTEYSTASNDVAVFFEVDFFGGLATWQDHTLEKREINPSITSLEVFLQVGSQPSNYYIINPRVRGTWGIFSTDFRFNFMIEEGIEGFESIRTDDWQIVELNVVTTRNVIARIGGGFLHENFSGGKTFSEWTTSLDVLSNNRKVGGMAEFRSAEPRKEGSIQFQSRISYGRSVSTYATLGVIFQQYYSKINVWGVQCGLVMRVF